MDALVAWIESTSLSVFVNSYSWIWPAAETLHFLGLAILIGTVGVLDLRLLGFMKRLPVLPLNRLVDWGIAGFVVNLITGVVFLFGSPGQYANNIAFYYKLAFIVLAGINVLAFSFSGVERTVALLGPGDDAPRTAKVVAAVSLLLWFGVMYFGRMLPYIGNAF
jgi:hypothetical protein